MAGFQLITHGEMIIQNIVNKISTPGIPIALQQTGAGDTTLLIIIQIQLRITMMPFTTFLQIIRTL